MRGPEQGDKVDEIVRGSRTGRQRLMRLCVGPEQGDKGSWDCAWAPNRVTRVHEIMREFRTGRQGFMRLCVGPLQATRIHRIVIEWDPEGLEMVGKNEIWALLCTHISCLFIHYLWGHLYLCPINISISHLETIKLYCVAFNFVYFINSV